MARQIDCSRDERVVHIAYFDQSDAPCPNPGMGITLYAHSDHMHVGWDESELPEQLDRSTFLRMLELPHCDNLYIRMEWRDVQRSAGRLDLPEVWHWVLEAAETHGKPWALRIMPNSPHSLHRHSLPQFLEGKLRLIEYRPKRVPGPDVKAFAAYDGDYSRWWNELTHLLGEAFDAHPLLEFADISGYGFWGEWHHYGADPELDPDAKQRLLQSLVDAHLSAFRRTPAVVHLTPSDGSAKEAVTRDALARGCWTRRDSFYHWYTPWEYQMQRFVRQPGTAHVFEDIVPNQVHRNPPYRLTMDAERTVDRLLDVGFSYAAVGFNPWHAIEAHEVCPGVLGRLAARIGYRVRPSFVAHRFDEQERCCGVVVALVNDGVAAPSGTLRCKLRFDNGTELEEELAPGTPERGCMEFAQFTWPHGALGPALGFSLSLTITMKGKSWPVRWSVKDTGSLSDAGRSLRIEP